MPTMSVIQGLPELGMLMSLSAGFVEHYRRASIYVDRILRGARPADLPVEQPTAFELAIDLSTAKALGITIPRRYWHEPTRSSSSAEPLP